MRIKQRTLFDFSECIERKKSSQVHFEDSFKNHMSFFARTFYKAHTMVLEDMSRYPPHYRDKNYLATAMIGYVKGIFREHYGLDIACEDKKTRFFLNLNPNYKIFCKKLSCKYMPSNIETYHSSSILKQLSLPLEDDEASIVFLGYQVESSWNNLLGVYAVSVKDKKVEWVSDISNLGMRSLSTDIMSPVPPDNTPSPASPLVTIKKAVRTSQE